MSINSFKPISTEFKKNSIGVSQISKNLIDATIPFLFYFVLIHLELKR